MAMLSDVKIEGETVSLAWADGHRAAVPLLWLRDHCPCPACLHPETRQRLSDSFVGADIAARRISFAANDPALEIEWAEPRGTHLSRFEDAWLRAATQLGGAAREERELWDEARLGGAVPQVQYAALMAPGAAGDRALRQWLEQIARLGFAFVEGVPATPEATQAVARRAAYIRETIFGGYYDFTANMEHKDTAYTSMAIGPHTDGTYSFDAPGYQMFHCLGLDCTGGDSVLIDGFEIAAIMRAEMPDLYRVLTEVEVTGQYIDHEKGIHLMARRPVFRLDSAGRLVQVSYNPLDRAPIFLPEAELKAFYRAYGAFARLAGDRRLQYRRRLEPGSLVLFDNWRLLHARDAYQGYRRLAGAYLNKEDVESRLRVLRMREAELDAAA
ncbi:MAG TPA: trimethyllysine dioxygenase [Dongiaceae bacterium]|jgi:trimethyllysine dioxygenase|nr:trimethyllysine dioxygenase [Dongiaceae bacterium]